MLEHGGPAMRALQKRSHSVHKRSHGVSFFLSLLLVGGFATSAHAETTATKSGLWSDKSSWAGGAVPVQGDVVTIPQGVNLVLDASPPALNGMTISGKLSFADDTDLALSTEWFMVHGELEIGT